MTDPSGEPLDEYFGAFAKEIQKKLGPTYDAIAKAAAEPLTDKFAFMQQGVIERSGLAGISRAAASMIRIPTPSWQNASVLESLNGVGESFRKRAVAAAASLDRLKPRNWGDHDIGAIVDLVEVTGLPVIWVPRADVLNDLLDAGPANYKVVLLRHQAEILEDVEATAAEITNEGLRFLAECCAEAASSTRLGHTLASQALSAAIVGGVLERMGYTSFENAKAANAGDLGEVRLGDLRAGLLGASIVSALTTYYWRNHDPVPEGFSRHATAHHPQRDQMTPANALEGALLAVALLRELDEGLRTANAA